ncbi:MAG: hypothetical protein JW874_07640 [Spirochaetales bacterium]|nr:hypothetical protein [Spirochaetales bacterium]
MKEIAIKKSIVCILIFLFCIQAALSAQAGFRNARLYISIESGNDSGQNYLTVIEDAAKVEFGRTRLIITVIPPEDLPGLQAETDNSEPAPEAVFLLHGTYSIEGSYINIRFSWSELPAAGDAEIYAEKLRIDLSLDQEIGRMVSEIKDSKLERISRFAFLPEKEVEDTVIPEPPEKPPALPAAEKKPLGIRIVAGLGGFITLGRARDYFETGLVPAVSVSYLFHPRFGDIAVGLAFGLNSFEVNTVSPYNNYLIPAGLNTVYQISFTKRFLLSAGLSAGVAVLYVQPGDEEYAKTVFYSSCEAGVAFLFQRSFGLQLRADYYIFFESSEPIMGIVPGLYAFFRI